MEHLSIPVVVFNWIGWTDSLEYAEHYKGDLMAGRPARSAEVKNALLEITKEIFSEITEKSGKKSAALEQIFQIGTRDLNARDDRYDGHDGCYWRQLKNGHKPMTQTVVGNVIMQAVKKGWLGENYGFDYIVGILESDQQDRRIAAAKKIEKHISKICDILAHEMPDGYLANLAYLHGIGQRLTELYISRTRQTLDGFEGPSEKTNLIIEELIQFAEACSKNAPLNLK